MIKKICTGVATVFVCSALAVSSPLTVLASTGFGTAYSNTIENQEDNNQEETLRIVKFRLLKALNVLRDAGFTPQSIMEALRGSHAAPETAIEAGESASNALEERTGDVVSQLQSSAGSAISDATDGIAEAAGNAASDALNQATDVAKEKADEAIDDLGEQIEKSLQDFIAGIFHKSGEES